MIRRIHYIILIILIGSCVEEYMPDISKSENLLIVDGGITNDPGPYNIILSISQGVQDAITLPYSGAQVVIEEKDGPVRYFN